MLAEVLDRLFQRCILTLDSTNPKQRPACGRGDGVEVELPNLALILLVPEVADLFACGDKAETGIASPKLVQQHFQAGVLDLAAIKGLAGLEGLQPVEQEECPVFPDEIRQPLPAVPGREPFALRCIAKPRERMADELVRRGDTLVGPLAVKRPGKDPLRPTIIVQRHILDPSPHQARLADTAGRLEHSDVESLSFQI